MIGQGGMVFQLKEGRCKLAVKGKLFAQRAVRRWHCCPELWVPHPWRCPRPWMGPGQPELVEDSQPMAEDGTGWALRSLPLYDIL